LALGCVFVLNAVALFIFPGIGHWFALTTGAIRLLGGDRGARHQFPSSETAARYAPEALAIAVPVKLARALWILPMVAVAGGARAETRRTGQHSVVLFFLFVGASAIASFVALGRAGLSRAGRQSRKAGWR